MKQLNEIWFWFSLTVLPVIALFGFGYLVGQMAYSNGFKFESVAHFSIIPLSICAAFQFKRALAAAKLRFQRSCI